MMRSDCCGAPVSTCVGYTRLQTCGKCGKLCGVRIGSGNYGGSTPAEDHDRRRYVPWVALGVALGLLACVATLFVWGLNIVS